MVIAYPVAAPMSTLEGPRMRIVRMLRSYHPHALPVGVIASVLGQDTPEVLRLIQPLVEQGLIGFHDNVVSLTAEGHHQE